MITKSNIRVDWLLFGVFLILYLILPNNNQGYDSYSYAISAKDSSDFFHPHHLIYNLFGYLLNSVFSFTGLGSLKILSLANSIFAVFTLLFIYRIIISKSNRFEAIAGTILAGSIFSFWYYATSVEVNMPAIFCVVIALYFLLVKDKHPASGWLVYLILCLGVLFHQIVALVGIPILVFDMIRSGSITAALKRAHPGILAGALIYTIVAIENAAEKNALGVYRWITQYGHAGEWGKLSAANISQGVWGKIKALYGGEVVREIFYSGEWSVFSIIVVILMAIIYLGFTYIFIVVSLNVFKNRDRVRGMYLLLMVVLSLFVFWWAPHDDGFWLYPIVIFCLYIFSWPFTKKIHKVVTIITISILFEMNVVCEFIPSSNKDNSHIYQAASAFKRLEFTACDLVITNLSQARLAYEYYSGIHVPTTCMMFLPNGEKDDILKGYHKRITGALDTARVYMFEDEIFPDKYRGYLFNRFNYDNYLDTYQQYYKYLTPVDSIYMHGRYSKIFKLNMQANQ